MTSSTVLHQGPSPEHEEYDLSAVVRHNAQTAQTSTEQFPDYHEMKGLGIYPDTYQVYNDHSYVHNPPTPRSNTASEGVRTRSGRSTKRTDSPFSSGKSRVSKSPAPRKKDKKKKGKLDKSKAPSMVVPLSIATRDYEVPCRDMEEYVNRPFEERWKEDEKRNGYIARPMNSFMLYRSCYADRTKVFCKLNNHQVVSSVSGASWPEEPEEVRQQFFEWAKIERQNHLDAHPGYKFSPKANGKRRKGEISDDDEEPSDFDERNPDGEYRGGSGRSVRQKREPREIGYLPSNVGFGSHPYYDQQPSEYEQSQFQYANPGRPLPSNVGYDHYGQPYDPRTSTYFQQPGQQQQYPPNAYIPEVNLAPGATAPGQALGGFGLPGGYSSEDMFTSSRTSTPMDQYQQNGPQLFYQQYGPQYQQQAYQQASTAPNPQPGSQQYEHAQYLIQPQTAIDPTLPGPYNRSAHSAPNGPPAESHFADAISLPNEYYDPHRVTSPDNANATLAPTATWSPMEEL